MYDYRDHRIQGVPRVNLSCHAEELEAVAVQRMVDFL